MLPRPPLRMSSAARAAFWTLSRSSSSALHLSATPSLARSISASISPSHRSISLVILSMFSGGRPAPAATRRREAQRAWSRRLPPLSRR
uniref:Uncharacterized protein n=1 Tax=Arundo donax TaxID=35708 RepID=A0A0A9C2S7_ARUDO